MAYGALLFLLLPCAVLSGWFAAIKNERGQAIKSKSRLPRDYIVGLNYLLNEQPDKAVDVFIKMLTVDTDTVETHLALGNLFRRRGEVDRALRVHQNLIARPSLDRESRIQALLELAQDYMRAGVLDRAERLFLEVVDSGQFREISLHNLLDIYQQEKSWEAALGIAEKLETVTGKSQRVPIAHYYCELAQIAELQKRYDTARKHLTKALRVDKQCARASLMYGRIEISREAYEAALEHFKTIRLQDIDYFSEALPHIVACYEALGQQDVMLNYLESSLVHCPRLPLFITLAEKLKEKYDANKAITFLAEQLQKYPSVQGLQLLVELELSAGQNADNNVLKNLNAMLKKMTQNKPVYQCRRCGFHGNQIHWLCPSCKTWSAVKLNHGSEGEGNGK